MKLLVTGQTGSGKTSYLLKIAQHEAFIGNRVAMFTGETSEYISNLLPRLNAIDTIDHISIFHGVRTIQDIRDELFNGTMYHTIIIDGIQYLVDISNMNECEEKLGSFLYMSKVNVYFSVPTRKEVFRSTSEPHGSSWLASVVDRISKIEDNGNRLTILKDRFGTSIDYPINTRIDR